MMIPNYINSSSPSPFVMESSKDHDQINHQFFVPNYQSASSSSSLSCHVFFNSSSTPQDQTEFYPTMIHHPPHHQEVESQAGSYDLEKKDSKKSLKLTLWKNHEKQTDVDQEESPAKWMSSKMRVMQKMKNSANLEDQNKQASSSLEADHLSSNSSSYHTNPTIRVCADCNTTKTPLWRSGPQGPKSLCNACGIRQRKARRAMAAAAAAAANNGGRTLNSETATTLKIKVQNNKEKINNSVPFKKRCKMINSSESSHQYSQKNNVFEDFLFNLSKNLAFQRVFPQDEKEAAILLMALSCGLVHG